MTLKEAAELAPLWTAMMTTITVCIAATAAFIAWRAIGAQRDIARRRASIDFFLKTETDKTLIDLYEKYKRLGPTIKSAEPAEFTKSPDYQDVRAFLTGC
jgi:hypothetical protein